MTETLLLGRRAVREVIRYPEATIPALFIPLFFLAVNIGQVSETFPDTTPFLKGQGYAAFQLPVSLMFAVATATSGLALVTEIDNGYFDKLLAAPIRRSSIIFGRLTPVMEALARVNPVSYVIVGLRSLVIDGWVWDKLAVCLGVIIALTAVLTALSLRAIATYDRD